MKKYNNMKHQNLLTILKMFQNRPHHLAEFLVDNNAFTKGFLDKISNSEKISDIFKNGISDDNMHFNTILEMGKYYSSLIDDFGNSKEDKSKDQLETEFNRSLRMSIDKEDYEEAARIRDYMKLNKIKKK